MSRFHPPSLQTRDRPFAFQQGLLGAFLVHHQASFSHRYKVVCCDCCTCRALLFFPRHRCHFACSVRRKVAGKVGRASCLNRKKSFTTWKDLQWYAVGQILEFRPRLRGSTCAISTSPLSDSSSSCTTSTTSATDFLQIESHRHNIRSP